MFFITSKTLLGEAFAGILTGICNAVAAYVAGAGAQAPFLTLLYHRLRRTAYRLDRLVAQWQAGTLPAPRPSRPRAARPARPPELRLSRSHGWVFRHAQRTAQFIGQVEAFLARPDARDLVVAAPQAGRLLRPLCRLFAIPPPPWLQLPERPAPARKPRPVAVRPPSPPGTPDRPLPANIRAAARAWRSKFG